METLICNRLAQSTVKIYLQSFLKVTALRRCTEGAMTSFFRWTPSTKPSTSKILRKCSLLQNCPKYCKNLSVRFSRTGRLQMFFKIGVLENFTNFTGKHLCWSLFLNKVPGLKTYNFIKRRLHHRCCPAKFVTFFKSILFTEHLRWLLLTFSK